MCWCTSQKCTIHIVGNKQCINYACNAVRLFKHQGASICATHRVEHRIFIILFIPPSILYTIYPTGWRKNFKPILGDSQGSVYPGQNGNLRQCTIRHMYTLLFTLYKQLQDPMAYNLCLWTWRGNQSTWRKLLDMRTPHTWWRWK